MTDKRRSSVIGLGIVGGVVGFVYLLTRRGEAHPEDIILSNLVISPSQIYTGESVAIGVTVTNMGNEVSIKSISCEVV